MKKRHANLLLLIALVVLPMALLGWQAWRLLTSERDVQQARYDQLVEARLQQVDLTIQRYLESLANDWQQRLPSWPLDPRGVRTRLADEIRVRHLFLLGPDNQRLFPADPLSSDEQAFVERLEAIWRDPSLLQGNRPASESDTVASRAPALSNVFRKSARETAGIAPESGWYMWHWGAGTRLIFWWKSPGGETIGLALEPARLKSDLIGILPEDDSADYSIRLRDAAGQEIYRWGSYELEPGEQYHQYPLSYPLSSWALEYAGTPPTAAAAGFGLLLLLASLGLVLIGLALYLYREQTRELREAARKVEFVGQVSHELKTPLTNIRMYAELLDEQLEDEPQQRNYLGIIISESQRLGRLIGNVLTFSRTPTLHLTEVDIDGLVRQTLDHFLPGFRARGLEVRTDLQAGISINSDADMLEQILNNLLSNVEKYASGGGIVEVATSVADGHLLVSVRDHGAGIPAAERRKIFEPFYRIDNSLTEGVSGTGIGLTIARQQAGRLGGELLVSDARPGARFTLKLPLDRGETP
jgi:signal transduction histidine kinase